MSKIPPSDPKASKGSPYASPRPRHDPAGVPMESEGDATGGVIPYKNVPALAAYYLGLFSLFPILGLGLAVPALILGIKGLNKRKQNPAVSGAFHAWVGIVMGGIFTLVWGAGSAFLLYVWLSSGAR